MGVLIDIYHLKAHICNLLIIIWIFRYQPYPVYIFTLNPIQILREFRNILLVSPSRRLQAWWIFPTSIWNISRILRTTGIKYSHNQDDQEDHEYPANVFFKDRGVLMDIFYFRHHICYLFIILGKNNSAFLFQSFWHTSGPFLSSWLWSMWLKWLYFVPFAQRIVKILHI